MQTLTAGFCLAASVALMGCKSYPAPAVPQAIAAPPGSSQFLETQATGVQIYKCAKLADAKYAWEAVAPEAVLRDRFGSVIGKHYAGPTWELTDGSSAQGQVVARDAGPVPTAVPWLLLAATPKSGNGGLAAAKYVQRLNTVGGVAPVSGCGEASIGLEARIAYSASYVFYR